ncbi:MAG: putative lipid II flippase FtsW [Holosporales bacterium]|jgi:cell division protein FtsW|nr:putative lipid II flippase FtsW [Holosporales bacterium]
MSKFIRRDTSVLGNWWWTVDHWLLISVLTLVVIGIILSVSASPFVATKIGFNRFYFVKRHLLMVPISVVTMIIISLLSPMNIRKLSAIILLASIILLIYVLLFGHDVKGSKRWLIIFGISVQPSEFVKPAFFVIVAWLLAERHLDDHFAGTKVSIVLMSIIAGLTLCQPDIGMTFIIIAPCLMQVFVAGLRLVYVIGAIIFAISGFIVSYFFIPHVTKRVDAFFHPQFNDADQLYQIRQSMEAFHNGGWFGCGPGEGVVKRFVPDAHSDFVFSVAGEEYGIFLCLFIACLFCFIVIRSLLLVFNNQDAFAIYSITGLATQFGLQSFINMSTALKLIPTKGMTLPFISFGGSSMLSASIAMGFILALTRRRHGVILE